MRGTTFSFSLPTAPLILVGNDLSASEPHQLAKNATASFATQSEELPGVRNSYSSDPNGYISPIVLDVPIDTTKTTDSAEERR